MQFLITGGSGFIGKHLAEHCAAAGHSMVALVRDTLRAQHLAHLGARIVQGDLATGSGLTEALRGADCVLHLAGVIKAFTRAQYTDVNVEGTRRLCAAAAAERRRPRMVLCSSLAAAGPSAPGRPRLEEDVPRPVSHYGRSKLAGEVVLREFSDRLPAAIVRPPIVYGPGDVEFLPAMSAMVRRGVLVAAGFGARWYSLIHVDDLCRALLAVAVNNRTVLSHSDPVAGLYYVADGREYQDSDIATAVAQHLGVPDPVRVSIPVAAASAVAATTMLVGLARKRPPILNVDKVREARCAAWTCSPRRIAQDLGFTPAIGLPAGLDGALRTPESRST